MDGREAVTREGGACEVALAAVWSSAHRLVEMGDKRSLLLHGFVKQAAGEQEAGCRAAVWDCGCIVLYGSEAHMVLNDMIMPLIRSMDSSVGTHGHRKQTSRQISVYECTYECAHFASPTR